MTSAMTWRMGLAAPLLVTAVASSVLFSRSAADKPETDVLGLSIKPAAAGGNGNGNNGNGNGNNGGGNPAKGFTLAGVVTGLAPGVPRTVALRVTNPNSQAIRVQTLTATATGGTTACPNSMLLLGTGATAGQGSMTLNLVVAGNGQTTATTDPLFPVKLAPNAPNGCKSFQWTLVLGGTAAQA